MTTSIQADEEDPAPTEITVQVQGTDVAENQIPSIADGDYEEGKALKDKKSALTIRSLPLRNSFRRCDYTQRLQRSLLLWDCT